MKANDAKVAIITGAGHGIGRACAAELSTKGWAFLYQADSQPGQSGARTPDASLCGVLECFRKHSVKDLIAANKMMEQGRGRMQRDNGEQ